MTVLDTMETASEPRHRSSFGACHGLPPQYETSDEIEDHSQAFETVSEQSLGLQIITRTKEHSNWDIDSTPTVEGNHEYFQVGIPSFSNGLTTFAYQQALRNRISEAKLLRHAEYDMQKYTPTFIHDCLMLPGSLANLLGKLSPVDVIHRMTPALLPGFRARVDYEAGQPSLIAFTTPTDYVQGMLIFGQGKTGRKLIHKHYRPLARRTKVLVETDVVVSIPPTSRESPTERWQLQRRRIKARAWISTSDVCKIHPLFCPEKPAWTLEAYLASTNDDDASLRIDPATYDIDEDGGVALPCDLDKPEREVVHAGCGHLDWERVEEGWSGW